MANVITIRDLVEMPHLGIRVISGGGGLSRAATWAHGCELEDPTGWLDGGEIIMTNGIAIPANAEGQQAYVDRLSDRGCAAIAIGDNQHAPPLTEEMLARADERDLPVLVVEWDVPFVALSRAVAQGNQAEDHDRLADHLRIYDAIGALGGSTVDADALLAQLERITGYRLWIVTEEGRRLAGTSDPIPDELLAVIPRPARQPPRVGDGFVVPLALDGVVAGYLIADLAQGEPRADLTAIHHIATLATLELANIHRAREAERRHGAELLSELLHGGIATSAAATCISGAGSPDARLLAVVCLGDSGELVDTRISSRLHDREVNHLQLRVGERLWIVIAEIDLATLHAVLPRCSGVGVSRPFRAATSFIEPQREAAWALERSRLVGGEPTMFTDREPTLRWLPADATTLEGLINGTLGPVLAYDDEHQSSLLHTLRTYLETNRRPSEAARALHCHRHTLMYRLRRVEELTGRDLRRTGDVSDFWLALRAQTALAAEPTPV